jgi:outer membrane protein TolC
LLCERARAENSRPLSLGQAIERAIAGNADLRRERVAVAKAAANLTSAEGRFDLLLESSFTTKREDTPALPSCPASTCMDLAAGATTTTTLGLGLSRNLETGGNLKLAGSATQLSAVLPPGQNLNVEGTLYSSNLTLTFTHPLLRGFGTEIAQANLRKARIEQDMAQLGRQMRACNVLRDVVTGYWELAYATQDLAIKRSAVELAQEQLRTTEAMIGAGRLADADAAAVERAIAQRQEELATAEQNLYLRSLDLQRLFGEPAEARAPLLAATDAPTHDGATIDEAAEIERALAANPQLRALKLGLGLSELDLATARSTLRPKLDFAGSVGAVGRRSDLGDSLKQTTGFGELAWSAGLVFELPVQNRTARGQMRAAEEDLNLAHIDAQDFALKVEDLVLRATSSIRTTAKRVELGQREVEFARQSLDAEKARFQAGRATNNDVLLRQQELKDAETRLLRATVDQNESEATLAAVTAEVLDRYGVVLKGR